MNQENKKAVEAMVERAARIAHAVFQAEGWTWGFGEDTPSEAELARTYGWLIEMTLEQDTESMSTGRLTAQVFKYKGWTDVVLSVEVGHGSLDEVTS